MNKNVLITGVSGMLGKSVCRSFLKSEKYHVYGISRKVDYSVSGVTMFYGDLSSADFVNSIDHIFFDAIIHCSAEVNVNLCEKDRDLAYKSNVEATMNVFSILKAKKYIYISTDSVFDGDNGDYLENSKVNPLNYYAETKFLGENAVKECTPSYYILRTNIYGFNKPIKNSLFEWGYSELNKGIELNGFANMFFNPLYVGQLAELIEQIVEKDIEFGVYNTSCDDKISKYDFLQKIAREFGFSSDLIKPVIFKQTDLIAKRALNTTLNNSKIHKAIKTFDFSINKGFSMLKKDLKNE
ncbi:SDR family oxidoreductase [Flavobacterium circumlabens]|uniref:dTDP-4-dehydrorhamnose reductase n=1 Tax=Flavobacterium circumlabens TaxID=2133765 RepID=A0A4Y7UAD2_9FLAO|nr:SDR family oxidoreductase [Flavobacterium circumlabens]TCN56359.1 dTDP-4-dehydrorhamnose reductase [Flavobacterium circumlabens]TEB43396.1 SDR family oxidoreductase [Flavobacterium circumlabens]